MCQFAQLFPTANDGFCQQISLECHHFPYDVIELKDSHSLIKDFPFLFSFQSFHENAVSYSFIWCGANCVCISLLITCQRIQWLALNEYESLSQTCLIFIVEKYLSHLDGEKSVQILLLHQIHNKLEIGCQLNLNERNLTLKKQFGGDGWVFKQFRVVSIKLESITLSFTIISFILPMHS